MGLPVAVTSFASRAQLLSWHPLGSLRPALWAIALLIAIPLLAAVAGTLLATGVRRLLRRSRPTEPELRSAADFEARLRAAMSELCPNGWRAYVTLFGAEDELPADAPADQAGQGSRVALDWAELDEDGNDAVIVRRVWAGTVAEAMEAMVADRRTDETLEQIERAAVWPD
ncbi:MAG TPA: hypothetical protein VFP55_04630 [Solirubrobacteraceae bacterium]|nr:hypothetical protein [Solirubrobacteraceae bacterium]